MHQTIDYFMWGYQSHFRFNCEFEAKRVFQMLDKRFDPEIFLVGVFHEDRSDRFTAFVDPEEDSWIQSEDFCDVISHAEHLIETYPDKELIQSHPIAQQ